MKHHAETFKALFRAKDALVHGDPDGGSGTNMQVFRREHVLLDGKAKLLPIISGNQIRHRLRAKAALFLFDAVGLQPSDIKSARMTHLLFHGGNIAKGSKSKPYSAADARRVAELLPILAAFGGNLPGGTWEGLFDVGMLYPVIEENEERLGVMCKQKSITAASIMENQSFTASDCGTTQPHLILPNDDGAALTLVPLEDDRSQWLKDKDKKREAKERKTKSPDEKRMIYEIETMVAGTELVHQFRIKPLAPPLVRSFIGHTVRLWLADPYIGGKNAVGFGELEPLEYEGNPAYHGLPSPDLYLEHLEEGKDSIREAILELAGEMK